MQRPRLASVHSCRIKGKIVERVRERLGGNSPVPTGVLAQSWQWHTNCIGRQLASHRAEDVGALAQLLLHLEHHPHRILQTAVLQWLRSHPASRGGYPQLQTRGVLPPRTTLERKVLGVEQASKGSTQLQMHLEQVPTAVHLERLDLHGVGEGGRRGGVVVDRSGCPASMTHKLRQMQQPDNGRQSEPPPLAGIGIEIGADEEEHVSDFPFY